MRIRLENKINHRPEEKGFLAGLFSKKTFINDYIVSLFIQMSEEEKAILTHHMLWDTVLFSAPFRVSEDDLRKYPELGSQIGEACNYRIKDFCSDTGCHQTFSTPVDAKNFETHLRNDLLPKLKSYVDASRDAGKPTSDTFEL
jgi:hypothetical protein